MGFFGGDIVVRITCFIQHRLRWKMLTIAEHIVIIGFTKQQMVALEVVGEIKIAKHLKTDQIQDRIGMQLILLRINFNPCLTRQGDDHTNDSRLDR